MSFHVIIPARFQSSRLPGKPLSKIGELTMIERVCDKSKESGAISVTVATDHHDIAECVTKAGYNAVMTRSDHISGSDRLYEASEILGLSEDDVIVNVQGDEPFIPSGNIAQVAAIIEQRNAAMATLCCGISDSKEAADPNSVKVIFDKHNRAIYFSRAQIPFIRDTESINETFESIYYRHIGIYAYKKSLLSKFVKWPESRLESLEKLEQLRVLENGENIYLDILESAPPSGIDTPEDLLRANQLVTQR